MLGIWQDLRHGALMLAKNPGFSLIAILSIAIGVGANAAMFSVADGLVLRPLPVPDANALVIVSTTTPTGQVQNSAISYPDFLDLRDRARRFEGLAASRTVVASFVRSRDEVAQSKVGLAVSANFFDLLHITPALGRGFVPGEDRVNAGAAVMVLTHETWTDQFGGDPTIIGREVRLRGLPFTVIGVAPEGFAGLDIYVPPAFYIPVSMAAAFDAATPDLARLDACVRTPRSPRHVMKQLPSLARSNKSIQTPTSATGCCSGPRPMRAGPSTRRSRRSARSSSASLWQWCSRPAPTSPVCSRAVPPFARVKLPFAWRSAAAVGALSAS
jgi:MacB-like protein